MRSWTSEYKTFRRLVSTGGISLMLWMAACSGGGDASATCENYCDQSLATCTAGNAQYSNQTECLDECAKFSTQGADGDEKGDTLQCRMYHLGVAAMVEPMLHCPHSGPTGAGVCVDGEATQCERYCGLIDEQCGGAPQYDSIPECVTECDNNMRQAMEATGNTVQCRLNVLLDANDSMTLGERCKDAGKTGETTTCVDVSATP
jgi:hypothetical protein